MGMILDPKTRQFVPDPSLQSTGWGMIKYSPTEMANAEAIRARTDLTKSLIKQLGGAVGGASGIGSSVGGGGGTGGGSVGDWTRDNRFKTGLNSAEGRLSSLLDDPNSVQESAAYKFRVGQGQQALERSLAAKGMLGSGNRLMELTKYGQDMGSQEYENQYGRLSGLLGQYMGGYGAEAGNISAERVGRLNVEANNALQEQRLGQQSQQFQQQFQQQTLNDLLRWV